MSEYQYVAFRAIDGPVSETNLAFMRKQSSRAEITPFSFGNEYQYGDFRGNALEMLRRGYDLHLHYANYGIRSLLIRLPNGLPDSRACQPYLDDESIQFIRDKSGASGTLSISPFYEPGDLEELWDLEELMDRLVPLRAEILDGDLRPLYLAHLAVGSDGDHDPEETTEGPVPAGLKKLSDAQQALAELYGLVDSLIAAAAKLSQPLPAKAELSISHEEWLRSLPQTVKDGWLARLLSESHAEARREILSAFRKTLRAPVWPVTPPARTIAQLQALATGQELKQATAVEAASKRAKKPRFPKRSQS